MYNKSWLNYIYIFDFIYVLFLCQSRATYTSLIFHQSDMKLWSHPIIINSGEARLMCQLPTCVSRSRGRVGAVGAVSTVRRVKTKVVRLCIIWPSARGAAVVLVRAQLAERRSCAMARLLAVVVAAVRRRGHRQSRGLLRLVQAVVTAWGNLVRMHISV